MLVISTDGDALGRDEADALNLISAAWEHDADWVAVPVQRLDPAFFDLSTRIAGEITQKLVNYRIGLAVIGDLKTYIDRSSALAAFVSESNRGRHLRFATNLDELGERLARTGSAT